MILMCSASTESAEYLGSAFIIHDLGRLLAAIRVIELRRERGLKLSPHNATINAFYMIRNPSTSVRRAPCYYILALGMSQQAPRIEAQTEHS